MIEQHKPSFDKAIEHLEKEISTLRTGRATPALVEDIKVDSYGMMQPLKSVASITVQDAKTILVSPWDKTVVPAIDSALRKSDIGLNPVNDGVVLRIPLPELTHDRRQDLIKVLHNKLEQARITVRKIREDVRNELDKLEKLKEISEDDRYVAQEGLEKMVKSFNAQVKEIGEKKEKEINTI